MKTRIALALVLAFGVMATGPATSGAVISDSDQAAEVQYPDIQASAPQTERAESNSLPVTGYVAIPLLLTGAGLLLAGGVMHFRTRREQ